MLTLHVYPIVPTNPYVELPNFPKIRGDNANFARVPGFLENETNEQFYSSIIN